MRGTAADGRGLFADNFVTPLSWLLCNLEDFFGEKNNNQSVYFM